MHKGPFRVAGKSIWGGRPALNRIALVPQLKFDKNVKISKAAKTNLYCLKLIKNYIHSQAAQFLAHMHTIFPPHFLYDSMGSSNFSNS